MATVHFIGHAPVFPILFKPFQPSGVFLSSSLMAPDFSVENEVYTPFLRLGPACLFSCHRICYPLNAFCVLVMKGF